MLCTVCVCVCVCVTTDVAPTVTGVVRGSSGRHCWNMQLRMRPCSGQVWNGITHYGMESLHPYTLYPRLFHLNTKICHALSLLPLLVLPYPHWKGGHGLRRHVMDQEWNCKYLYIVIINNMM